MIIYSKPCTIDGWDMKTNGSLGSGHGKPSNRTPKPVPEDKGIEFITENEFKI